MPRGTPKAEGSCAHPLGRTEPPLPDTRYPQGSGALPPRPAGSPGAEGALTPLHDVHGGGGFPQCPAVPLGVSAPAASRARRTRPAPLRRPPPSCLRARLPAWPLPASPAPGAARGRGRTPIAALIPIFASLFPRESSPRRGKPRIPPDSKMAAPGLPPLAGEEPEGRDGAEGAKDRTRRGTKQLGLKRQNITCVKFNCPEG